MKEGLWKRFKEFTSKIVKYNFDMIPYDSIYRYAGEEPVSTFVIKIHIPRPYLPTALVLFRWFVIKFNKAIKEIRNE